MENNDGLLLFFDTETTGLPQNYNLPSSATENWPRLVQLSWIVTDIEGNRIKEEDHIIFPEDFKIPEAATAIHGISTDKAREEGEPVSEVLERFTEDVKRSMVVVGHNVEFDKHVVGAELIRLHLEDIMETKNSFCTMHSTVDFCAIEGYYGYKYPKLQELHTTLFGSPFKDAHNAFSDVTATEKCFRELVRRDVIQLDIPKKDQTRKESLEPSGQARHQIRR